MAIQSQPLMRVNAMQESVYLRPSTDAVRKTQQLKRSSNCLNSPGTHSLLPHSAPPFTNFSCFLLTALSPTAISIILPQRTKHSRRAYSSSTIAASVSVVDLRELRKRRVVLPCCFFGAGEADLSALLLSLRLCV